MTEDWHQVCKTDELEEEEARRFNHAGKTYAIYNTGRAHYATDGMCTHEMAHLARGTVIGEFVECPLHQGRFHIPTGKAKGAPACIDLKTYPVKIEDGSIFIALPRADPDRMDSPKAIHRPGDSALTPRHGADSHALSKPRLGSEKT